MPGGQKRRVDRSHYGVAMAMTGERFEIAAGPYRAAACEVGAGLAGLWCRDAAVTVPHPQDAVPPSSNGAVLLPWPNRIRGGAYAFAGRTHQLPLSEPAHLNANHGLVRWSRWQPTERDGAAVTLSHDLVAQPGYPFELRFEVRYSLEAGSGLTVAARAVNTGVQSAPFGAGFHPYLDLGDVDLDHTELSLPAATVLDVDGGLIPIGRRAVARTPYDLQRLRPLGSLRLDHGFTDLTGDRATVVAAGRRTELWWDGAFTVLQAFTPDPAKIGAHGIAIEPMTCPADAFNSGTGLVVLEPGQQWLGSWGITVAD
jgi:aldose 1-epimerase